MNDYTDLELQSILAGLYFEHKQTLNQRLVRSDIKQELLIKAIGKGRYHSVLDATTGLGRDAFLMASVSEKLLCFERHPELYQHLERIFKVGQQNETLSPLLKKMTLINQCAIVFLTQYAGEPFDVIYCDPMFPVRTKSALPKKESQYLQKMVGKDEDAEQLIEVALNKARHRVVVKRPITSPILIQKPTLQYKARAHRFDVYCVGT